MGLVVSTFGDHLHAESSACLPVLVDRMGNEITRLTAVEAFAVIAASPLHLDLSCVIEQVISELTACLRKANRALGQATLGTLNTLIVAYGEKIGSEAYEVNCYETFYANKRFTKRDMKMVGGDYGTKLYVSNLDYGVSNDDIRSRRGEFSTDGVIKYQKLSSFLSQAGYVGEDVES